MANVVNAQTDREQGAAQAVADAASQVPTPPPTPAESLEASQDATIREAHKKMENPENVGPAAEATPAPQEQGQLPPMNSLMDVIPSQMLFNRGARPATQFEAQQNVKTLWDFIAATSDDPSARGLADALTKKG
jgi:hypothetical protein